MRGELFLTTHRKTYCKASAYTHNNNEKNMKNRCTQQ